MSQKVRLWGLLLIVFAVLFISITQVYASFEGSYTVLGSKVGTQITPSFPAECSQNTAIILVDYTGIWIVEHTAPCSNPGS